MIFLISVTDIWLQYTDRIYRYYCVLRRLVNDLGNVYEGEAFVWVLV